MSANLDVVRSIFTAWECGDYSSVEWADPEIEFTLADGPDPESWTGIDGMAAGWRAFNHTWEDFRAEVTECREVDDEHVLVLVQFHGRAKAGGLDLAQMDTQQANVFHVRDGKVVRLALYWDREHALADLRLAE